MTRTGFALAGLLCCGMLGARADAPPADLAQRVGFESHVGQAVAPELAFRDETGRAVRLGDYFGGPPVALVFTYFACTNLCPTYLQALAVRMAELEPGSAPLAQLLVVSVEPGDAPAAAAQRKAEILGPGAERAAPWHFLTGERAAIGQLTQAAGLRYVYDAASHQYAHPAGLVLLSPAGSIAGYAGGFDFRARDLATAFEQARSAQPLSTVQRLLLVCFHYDPITGKLSGAILATLKALSIGLLLAALALGAWRLSRAPGHPAG